MSSEKEKFDKFLHEEFNLLVNNEYNNVINDINDEIKNKEELIKDSFDKGKMLFSNYREVILYCDVNNCEATEPLDLDYVTMYGILGDAYFRREMYDEAKNAFIKAITLSPSNIILIQRLMNAYVRLEEYDKLEEQLFKSFKYCYTKEMLIEQYLLLITLYKYRKDYRACVYIYYLIGAAFKMNDYVANEITKFQNEVHEEYNVESFSIIMDFIKERNIPSPLDLSNYYYSIYLELAKKEEYRGALDFLNSSHSLFFNKQNLKDIKKLEKILKKID